MSKKNFIGDDGKEYVAKEKKPFYKKWWVWLIALFVIGSAIGGQENETTDVVGTSDSDIALEEKTVAPPEEDTDEKNEDVVTEPEEDDVSKEFKSALNKAKNYANTMNMSKQGVYEQLVSEYGENFPEDAAQYAIDNLTDVDWNENALKKATNYSDTMNMSKQGIYDQLISDFGEQFTESEAQYAIDNIKADFNTNALEKAKNYQDTMDMSIESIREQLTSSYGEGFTAEEAEYAINNLN